MMFSVYLVFGNLWLYQFYRETWELVMTPKIPPHALNMWDVCISRSHKLEAHKRSIMYIVITYLSTWFPYYKGIDILKFFYNYVLVLYLFM